MSVAVPESLGASPSARRVEAMVTRHGPALLRVANQFSLCHDDALDAYQRALEIYLRRLETVEVATEGAWMRVVVKHEAMAIRRARAASVDRDDVDLDAVHTGARDVDDQVAGGERVERSVEALKALKPDEAKALMLKAQGLSYQEIGRRFGWTYTKVNRSITEGRARFLKEFRGIEAGEACARHEDAIAALAAGTATSAQVVSIRPHLRHCAACRAAVRELRLSRRQRIALVLPGLPWALLARAAASDVGTGVQYASASGGARLGAAAALAGLCFAGAGAGAVCVVTGGVPAPPLISHADAEPAAKATPRARRTARPRKPVATATATPMATAYATATPARKAAAPRKPAARKSASSRPTGEFGFEGQAASNPGPSSGGVKATAASTGGGSGAGGGGSGGSGAKPAGGEFGFEGGG
jgi:RNA polymerase sigma factor (sigma-70 family)